MYLHGFALEALSGRYNGLRRPDFTLIASNLIIPNNVGIIDSSYYGNPDNDGNIAVALVNTTGQTVKLAGGSRIAQGIFMKYLVADGDETRAAERVGGIGSSGI